jgi:hypothetical protein
VAKRLCHSCGIMCNFGVSVDVGAKIGFPMISRVLGKSRIFSFCVIWVYVVWGFFSKSDAIDSCLFGRF